MRQGRNHSSSIRTLVSLALLVAVTSTVGAALAAGRSGSPRSTAAATSRPAERAEPLARDGSSDRPGAERRTSKPRETMRQFTGVVTALDKSSLTVEKHGAKPRTMVFVKHDEMPTTGVVDKDVRVTVYYRDDGGRAVAHRVVVKTATKAEKQSR